MSNGSWDRADYLEEDVRRHSEEIRTLSKALTEATSAVAIANTEISRLRMALDKQVDIMDKELERRQKVIEGHEKRLRDLEAWKARSGAYWAIFGSLAGGAAAYLISKLGKAVLP